MAKLLAARVAWANADNALQVHGGNGYAEEYRISRVLCDARILNIFEGAAEIQAQVIARGLLTPGAELSAASARVMIPIRAETAKDHAAVAEVNRLAFGGEGEVKLIRPPEALTIS